MEVGEEKGRKEKETLADFSRTIAGRKEESASIARRDNELAAAVVKKGKF